MQFDKLEMTIQYLSEILRHGRNPQIERLHYDIQHYYHKPYDSLSEAYKNVWDTMINLRLKTVLVPQAKVFNYVQELRQLYSRYMFYPSIQFGELCANACFQEAGVTEKEIVVGMPVIAGQNVTEYGENVLVAPNMADILPVHIFLHNDQWIAANSQEFAAHCVGGIKPLRLIPRLPFDCELERLQQVEGEQTTPVFLYNDGLKELETNPHTLPSWQLPIMPDSNSWNIENIVDVPEEWR